MQLNDIFPFHNRKENYLTQKLLRVMRLTTILIITSFMHVSAKTEGQRVTLHLKKVFVQKIIDETSRQSGTSIVYDADLFKDFPKVTVNVSNATAMDVLSQCLKNQPVVFSFEGNVIAIKSESVVSAQSPVTATPPGIINISGQIVDSLGKPFFGASVSVKETKDGTSTDGLGNFVLSGVKENATLVISYTGYQTVNIKVNKKTHFNITLYLAPESLLDVFVNKGYYTTTRKLNTGDISTIKAADIEKQPVPNVLEALEGRVSGLFITQQTGVPGGAINVLIRGQNSLRFGGGAPYYVVDGVPYPSASISSDYTSNVTGGGNPLNEINPLDIEQVEILKDADATAIYGSRGANGVILITTKRGRAGKMKLGIHFSSGFGEVAHEMKLLNTQEYLSMRHQAFANDQAIPQSYNVDLTLWDTTKYTNWQKELIGGTAHYSNAQATLSGGSELVQYLLSTSFQTQGTVFPASFSDDKISMHWSVNGLSRNKKLQVAFTGTYLNDNNQMSSNDLTYQAVTNVPNAPDLLDANGQLIWTGFYSNPLAYTKQPYQSKIDNLLGNLQVSYQFLKDFRFSLNAGYNQMKSNEHTANPVSSFNPAFGVTSGSATFATGSIASWIIEPQLNCTKKWNDFSIQTLIGGTIQQSNSDKQSLHGTGYSNDLLLGTLAGAGQMSVDNSVVTQYRYMAAYARLNLQWKDRYILNLTGRRDGSSRFGPNNQLANFGSAGLAWIFSEEPLFNQNDQILSFGKLRATYGSAGSDQIGDYGFLSIYSPTAYPYGSSSAVYPTSLANADFSWEINKKAEFGLDLGFIKDRILLSAVYYSNRSSNQLLGQTLPLITGMNSIQANLPATVQNTGLEFELTSTNIKSKSFLWKTSLNITFAKNKLLAFPNLSSSIYANYYVIGEPLTVNKAYQSTGVNPATGLYQFASLTQGGNTENPLYPEDLVSGQSISQEYYGGLLNSFQYHGFQLDFFFQFVKQTGLQYPYGPFPEPGMFFNQPAFVLDNWKKSGDQKPYQQFSHDYNLPAYNSYYNEQNSTSIVGDASFIRLKNVSLTYTFPASWQKALGGIQGNLFFRGQNLLTITHYQLLDPETQSLLHLPPLRMWTFGIQCNL